MKHILILFLIFYTSILSAQTNHLTSLMVKDNQFINTNGDTVILRGLNTSDPEKLNREGQWNDRYFKEISDWGSNVVRFPVHPAAWRKLGKDVYLQILDKGIELARKYQLYVIIDWHSIGNLCTEKFTNTGYITTRSETLEFWKIIGSRYNNEPVVAFLELFNEPTTNGGKLGDCSWTEWKKLVEEMILTIRNTGNKAIPLVAGFNWAYDLTDIKENPVEAEGIAYVSHPYPQKREKPWEEKWTADWGFAARKYPLILTEIGFCGPDDRGAHIPVISDESYGDAITAYCRENNISYVVWVFDPQWSPMLIHDWNFTPTRQGRYFKKALLEGINYE